MPKFTNISLSKGLQCGYLQSKELSLLCERHTPTVHETRNVLPWGRRQQVSLKFLYLYTKLHGVTNEITVI